MAEEGGPRDGTMGEGDGAVVVVYVHNRINLNIIMFIFNIGGEREEREEGGREERREWEREGEMRTWKEPVQGPKKHPPAAAMAWLQNPSKLKDRKS